MIFGTNFLDALGLTNDEFTDIINNNPSLRGVIIGYTAEKMLRKIFANDNRIQSLHKDDDHDRSKKGDLNVVYKDYTFRFECKSLQTNSIKKNKASAPYEMIGNYQCDASDCREISLKNNNKVKTTCLQVGEFDILAINMFAFNNKWDFAYILNKDLPRTKSSKYSDEDKQFLLHTSPKITLPLKEPYVNDPFILMDKLISYNTTI